MPIVNPLQITEKSEIDKYFGDDNGFAEHKHVAIDLLKQTIDILNEFQIDYFLISGTLLGYTRHNDFIPWDDDMDLIVDKSFMDKKDDIIKKYFDDNSDMMFCTWYQYIFKFSFKSKVHSFNRRKVKYNWPFVDLFIYDSNEKNLIFFNKLWDIKQFYPCKETLFHNIKVKIPNNSEYFLKRNYGDDYMTKLNSGNWNHKKEIPKKFKITTMEDYLKKSDATDN